MADRSHIPGVAVAVLCFVVAMNVIASAAHVHPWLGVAVLGVLAISVMARPAGTPRSRGPRPGPT